MTSLPKHYDSAAAATRFSQQYNEAGYARGNPDKGGPAFSMIMPPPNVTGSLHMGHALNNTLQDVMARYRRMDGDNVCWIPGLDHASIAVHWLVEKALHQEGTDRRAIGREAFLQRARALKDDVQEKITSQQRQLALSCDWQRLTFTLDEGPSRAVTEAFVRLYEDGLIYRDERLVNWDPVSQTSVSDLEVVYEENVQAEMFSFAYPFAKGEGELVVATTRPETMLGDTAVAVHPDDARYKHLIGQHLQHPFLDRLIPIVGDRVLVDPTFGTGAVKITPAHDFNDFEVGRRHKLPAINLLKPDGTLNEQAGPFAGQTVTDARENVTAELERMKLLRDRKPHTLSRGRSERSGAIIEPYLSQQWYVRTKPLRTPSLAAVKQGRTQFVPAAWQNTYFAWLEDIRDWCISRQLWWGHQIPAWTCDACKHLMVARAAPGACAQCEHKQLSRDPDVLDTWFSSALWPFSTQGWPDKGVLARYYPTQTLVTSFDIIFFWVARMMMLGQYFTGSVPFKDVYIHALIRDASGEKMSKTKGNVVDPLVMIERYGIDAFRFTLCAFAGQGRDVRWDEARAAGYQKFINKIWQAFRFVAMKMDDLPADTKQHLDDVASKASLSHSAHVFDAWLQDRIRHCVKEVRRALDTYKFNEAAEAIYHFTWDQLCDWSLELAKVTLHDEASAAPEKALVVRGLLNAFQTLARLLHPITPYLSEELYQALKTIDPRPASAAAAHVMVASFPKVTPTSAPSADIQEANFVLSVVRALRRVRADFHVPVKEQMQAFVRASDAQQQALKRHRAVLSTLSQADLCEGTPAEKGSALEWVQGAELVVPLAHLIDIDQERKKIEKTADKANKEAKALEGALSRKDFVERAPAEVVLDKRRQLQEATDLSERLTRALVRL